MNNAQKYTAILATAICMLAVALTLAGSSLYMSTKAKLAQLLLHEAWASSLESGTNTKPWRWADMSTVAKLTFPKLDKSYVVLDSASGEAMAFGPGLVAGNPQEAHSQTLAIGGHRDSHLAVLEHLKADEPVTLQALDGATHHYTMIDKYIVDSSRNDIGISSGKSGLVLITCYPFNATQTGGPLRMVAVFLPRHQYPNGPESTAYGPAL